MSQYIYNNNSLFLYIVTFITNNLYFPSSTCCRALRLTLQVWLDAYPEDFRDPPDFPGLQQLRTFTQTHLPDSDLHIKVGYKLDKMKKEEEVKGGWWC